MRGPDREADAERPTDRSQWFRRRALEVAGASVFDAFEMDRETASSGDVAFVAAVAAGVAHLHSSGAPLGALIDWTQERLATDTARAAMVAEKAYEHFRAGHGVPGLVWTPAPVYQAMLTWLESHEHADEAPAEASNRLAQSWWVDDDGASAIQRGARSWEDLASESFAAGHADLRAVAARPDVGAAVEALPALARTSQPVRALAEDVAIVRALTGDDAWASRRADLVADVKRRFDALTPLEQALLMPPPVPPTVLGWAEHRNKIFHANEIRMNGRTVMALVNAVCERVDDVSLIPDWVEMDVFNGRYLAGIAPGGPTATAWILPGDIEDLSTLQLDVDLMPGAEGRAGPPELAVYWRDGTRAPNDWSWVPLMIRDSADAWSWLAVLTITRCMRIDVLALDQDGNLQLVRGGLATMGEKVVAAWLDRFPAPPAYVAQGLDAILEGHVLGGLQAAERSKSYDLLELSADEATDAELLEARRDVLEAEVERADRVWGLREVDETALDGRRRRFQELRAWRYGMRTDVSIDPQAWQRDLTDGIATPTRAIVHMMVEDGGLALYWAGEDGRRGTVPTGAPVPPLLSALEPWTRGVSLRPRAGADPVAEMMTAATPVADALAELAGEEGFDHLVVVPWRGLHSVPWAAVGLTGGVPLAQSVRISHAPAIRMLRRSLEDPAEAGHVVAIGAHGGTLPRADAETELVAAIRGGVVVPDRTASDEIVRAMSQASVVHIAGHAGAGPHPFASALLAGDLPLGPSQITSSARIHADADLSRCRLVMINACDSGRYAPKPRSFENHTGLDTACLCAGAAVVISTLWPVNDLVATVVAAVTHRHLAEGMPPHRSLDAAVAVLRDGRGSSGVPAELHDPLDDALGTEWRDQLDAGAAALRHPYWWAAWRVSGADWLLD